MKKKFDSMQGRLHKLLPGKQRAGNDVQPRLLLKLPFQTISYRLTKLQTATRRHPKLAQLPYPAMQAAQQCAVIAPQKAANPHPELFAIQSGNFVAFF